MILRESKFGVALYGPAREIKDDFAGVDAPKLKFNFTLTLEYSNVLQGTTKGNEDPLKIDFGIKQITRPVPNIIYEDVNYYNFMTKVAVRVDFGIITVTLYDDRQNRAHDIFKNYMEAISPITKNNKSQAPLLYRAGLSTASTIGPLDEDARSGVIKNIRVTHFINNSGKKVIYDYLNPKIQSVILDELDMATSEVNTISFTFIYDTFNIIHEGGSDTSGVPKTESNIKLDELPLPPNKAAEEIKRRNPDDGILPPRLARI
jgi:hypothetical protein